MEKVHIGYKQSNFFGQVILGQHDSLWSLKRLD
jgi:hypothetical protein